MFQSLFVNSLVVSVCALQVVCGHECLELDGKDYGEFNIETLNGGYELVMGIMDDPFDSESMSCNGVTLRHHTHPKGGVSLAIAVEDIEDDSIIIESFLPVFNDSNDIQGVELAHFDIFLDQWLDMHCKILQSTEDVVVLTLCSKDEDNEENNRFLVFVLRKKGSDISIFSIRENLPDSVKRETDLIDLCDQ